MSSESNSSKESISAESSRHLIYITFASAQEAEDVAEKLLKEKLIACANISAMVNSVYFWEGEMKKEPEVVLLAKTSGAQVESTIEAVKKWHSYDCPCVVSWPITNGNPAFLDWIDEQTRP